MKTPITQKEITSSVIGLLKQDEFDDWWASDNIHIPFFNDQKQAVRFNFNPSEDKDFIREADEVLSHFLKKTPADRLAATPYVYKNCMDFLDSIGYNEDDAHLWDIQAPEEIWKYVKLRELYISREPYEDKGVYLQVVCRCDWEQEHGLQLVYNSKGKLIRVSAADGNIMGWQGDGMID